MVVLATDRLILRRWRDSDREPFAKINSDRRVMEFFSNTLSREDSDRFVDRIEAHFQKHEFGLFATELCADHTFIGYIGLAVPSFAAAFTPCRCRDWLEALSRSVGAGTRNRRCTGAGAFRIRHTKAGLLGFLYCAYQVRSRRVMERIGMIHDSAEDFQHPNLPEGHPMPTPCALSPPAS